MIPWLTTIENDIYCYDLDYQKKHHIYIKSYETNSGRCIGWEEFLIFKFSRESYKYSISIPVNRECFVVPDLKWKAQMEKICMDGYHNLDVFSWDRDFKTREVKKVMFGFLVKKGDGPDMDGYGRTLGTFFGAWIDGQGRLISPFQIVHR